jgi:hypothetical protein
MAEEAMEFARDDLEMEMGRSPRALQGMPGSPRRWSATPRGWMAWRSEPPRFSWSSPPDIEFDRAKAIERLEMAPPRELNFDCRSSEAWRR